MIFDPNLLFEKINQSRGKIIESLMNAPIETQVKKLLAKEQTLSSVLVKEVEFGLASYEVIPEEVESLFELNEDLKDFTKIRHIKVMQAFSKKAINSLLRSKQDFIQGLARQISRGILDESTLAEALSSIKGEIKTIIGTGLAGLQRQTQNAIASRLSDDGRTLALYTGGLIATSRGYCRALTGKVVDVDKLRLTPNGHGLDPSIFCGGWNCRHNLLPLNTKLAKQLVVTEATSLDYQEARAEI